MAILDDLNSDYSLSAEVAFSLRLLRTGYTGNCIRVRRSSDNTEQDIGFSSGYLDTASLLTFCGSGDGFVRTWYGQVNSKNLTQTTNSRQLKIVDSGSIVELVTGKAAMEMLTNDTSCFEPVSITATTGKNAFANCVVKIGTHSSNSRFLSAGEDDGTDSDFDGAVFLFKENSTTVSGKRFLTNLSGNTVASDDVCTLSSNWDGTNCQTFKNNSGGTAEANSFNFNFNSFYVGRDSGSSIESEAGTKFSEILFFRTDLSSAARADLETSQNNYWVDPGSSVTVTHTSAGLNFITTTHSVLNPVTITHANASFNMPNVTNNVFNPITVEHTAADFNFINTTYSVLNPRNIQHTVAEFNMTNVINELLNPVSVEHTTAEFNFENVDNAVLNPVELQHNSAELNMTNVTNDVLNPRLITHTHALLDYPNMTHDVIVTNTIVVEHTAANLNFQANEHNVLNPVEFQQVAAEFITANTTHNVSLGDNIDITHTTADFNYINTTHNVVSIAPVTVEHTAADFSNINTTHDVLNPRLILHTSADLSFDDVTHSTFISEPVIITHSSADFNCINVIHDYILSLNILIEHTADSFNFYDNTHDYIVSSVVIITHTTADFSYIDTTHNVVFVYGVIITHISADIEYIEVNNIVYCEGGLVENISTLLSHINDNIFFYDRPDEPDNCLIIYRTGGQKPIYTLDSEEPIFERPTFQVEVRNTVARTAREQAEEVKLALDGITGTIINDNIYELVTMQGDIFPVGKDNRERTSLTVNFIAYLKRN